MSQPEIEEKVQEIIQKLDSIFGKEYNICLLEPIYQCSTNPSAPSYETENNMISNPKKESDTIIITLNFLKMGHFFIF